MCLCKVTFYVCQRQSVWCVCLLDVTGVFAGLTGVCLHVSEARRATSRSAAACSEPDSKGPVVNACMWASPECIVPYRCVRMWCICVLVLGWI